MIVETSKYIFGGVCIAKLAKGKTLFVPFALPGEKLDIEIIKEKKDYCETRIIEIIKPSPHRVLPECEYFSICGGCDLQMMDGKEQHRLRVESAKELIERAHIAIDFPIEHVLGQDWQYRNRFQLHIYNKKIGFLGRKSNNIVHIKDCPIACEEMRKYLNTSPIFDDKHIDSSTIKNRLHAFAYNGKLWLEGQEKEVRLELLEHVFAFSPQAFFQSNIEMLVQLVEILQKYVGEAERVLDFYSGVGTFSSFFVHNAQELHLVEWNRYSIEKARVNLESAKAGCGVKLFFHCLNSEKWRTTKESELFYDVAIVDPPRSGIDKMTLGWFCKKKVKKMLYVSCDPATFARDASFLILNAGYRMEKCYFLNFYPQTHHLEVLGIFSL